MENTATWDSRRLIHSTKSTHNKYCSSVFSEDDPLKIAKLICIDEGIMCPKDQKMTIRFTLRNISKHPWGHPAYFKIRTTSESRTAIELKGMNPIPKVKGGIQPNATF